MKLDHQNLFGLHVYTAVLTGWDPATPIWTYMRGRYWSAKKHKRIHTEKGEGVEPERRLEEQQFTKLGLKN
jgi:hypothetical protein